MPRIDYFEDYRVGQMFETGSIVVTPEAIAAFLEYDPQIFHRPETAAAGLFGELVASGWQTAAYTMRLMVDAGVFPPSGGVGFGSDALRWLRPVRPGDSLHAVVRVDSLKGSAGRRNGLVTLDIVTRNQNGEDVMTQRATALVARRAPSPNADAP